MAGVFDYSARTLAGTDCSLASFEGQVLLIVNTASACGFTPQYDGLEKLHLTYAARGFAVLGFPCNQFGRQEPGDAQTIAAFCAQTFNVTFPMFDKIEVNGEGAHPLYVYLKGRQRGLLGSQAIKWNFTKFLTDRDGQVVGRYAPSTKPEQLATAIEALL
jgi:glutathione peroxidase